MTATVYVSDGHQGRPKAPPATQNASQKSLGDENKEVGGTKFKTVATRCRILRPKCTEFDFGWGFAPDPAGGAHSAPTDSLTGFEGVLLLRKGKGEGEEREERGQGREGRRGGGRNGRGEGCVMAFGGMDLPDGHNADYALFLLGAN